MAATSTPDTDPAKVVGSLDEVLSDLRRLGDGAEGGAWVGTDRASGRRVVAKAVGRAQRAEVRHAFDTLRRLASPHLPTPRAIVKGQGGELWLLHDFAEGESLTAGPVAPAVALGEAAAVAHALWTIHEAGSHHGDVSAANVVVTPTGGVVLVDLGHLGRLGAGTPGFLAPEVLAGGGGPAADRFALGCLLCLRLAGRLPWRRPEQLVAVRDRSDVRARLGALLPDADPPWIRLLVSLLDPDPRRRWPDTGSLVAHLRSLRDGAAGVGSAPRRWWPAGRLAYRGVELGEVVEALSGASRPRLVAIAGPPGSGRGRIGEEIVQSLQLRDVAARQCDADGLGHVVGRPGESWYEAWTTPAAGPDVVALAEPVAWAGAAADEPPRARAGRLAAGAALASRTLVLAVEPEIGEALRGRPGVYVVAVAPWTAETIGRALVGVIDDVDGSWAQALASATGGWAGRVAQAIDACARTDCAQPVTTAIEAALEAAGSDATALDPATARAVMVARWTGVDPKTVGVPAHLHDGQRPYGAAVASARARLQAGLRVLARQVLAETEGPVGLELALDAEHVASISRALAEPTPIGDGTQRRLVQWMLRGEASQLSTTDTAAVVRAELARGRAEAALALCDAVDDARRGAELSLQRGRALHRLGRGEEALAQLRIVADGDTEDSATWSARGLRWRLAVDAGRSEEAVAEATRALAVVPSGRAAAEGLATAYLWAAMAQLAIGDTGAAGQWLQKAGALAKDTNADGTLARVQQLRGNLALAGDDLGGARRCFTAAAGAFERAGEPVGATAVRGSLAALAIPTWATAAGLEHGRAALRSLLASGQRSATLEAALNLVQLLARVDARAEIAQLRTAVDDLWTGDRDPVVVARRARLAAEQQALAARHAGAAATAEHAFSQAADALQRAGLHREAVEARLRAAAWARRDGRLPDAAMHLRQAGAIEADDPDSAAGRVLEGVAQRIAAAADGAAAAAAASALSSLPPVARLTARGRIDLAWARDRLLLSALRRAEPPRSATRRAAARRLAKTLEDIMSKTSSVDRAAVRGALDSETGDAGALSELLEELGEDVAVATNAATPARTRVRGRAVAATRRDELLRIYRRLAREDRLERLLEQVVDAVMELTDAERGAVVVLSVDGKERVEVTRELGQGTAAVRFSRSVIDRVLSEGEPVLSVDAAADDRFDESRSISHLNLRSVLAVPLRFRGELVGAAYVDHRLRRGNFDEDDLAHMEEFAELAALAVAHARAVSALQARTQALVDQQRDLTERLEAREAEAATLRVQVQSAGVATTAAPAGMIGATEPMQRVFRLIDRLADTDVPVVIYGESGTGKELVARAIHEGGSRRKGPFVAENCAAIPETLLESVLFGHARGAFTGAQSAKPGLFEAAHGGTIFLDEVSEMSPGMQSKLLRVLQEGEVRRVGENASRAVDVRVVAASNRDLDSLVESGEFRRDLFYRINVVKLELPPLRARADDLPALIEHFVGRYAAGTGGLEITPAAMRRMGAYAWPGNVRELENEVQRWVALAEGSVDVDDLSPTLRAVSAQAPDPDDLRIRPRVDRLERELIEQALARTEGNQTRAAELLGLSRYGLQKKLRRMEIESP